MSTPYPTLQYGHSEEIGLLRETVYQFATTEIAPRAADIDRDNDFPRDLWTKMGDLGLLGITIPEQYGGSGMGYLAHAIAMEEISRASASVLRCALQSLSEPDSPEWLRGAEGAIFTGSVQWGTHRRTGHVRAGGRI